MYYPIGIEETEAIYENGGENADNLKGLSPFRYKTEAFLDRFCLPVVDPNSPLVSGLIDEFKGVFNSLVGGGADSNPAM